MVMMSISTVAKFHEVMMPINTVTKFHEDMMTISTMARFHVQDTHKHCGCFMKA